MACPGEPVFAAPVVRPPIYRPAVPEANALHLSSHAVCLTRGAGWPGRHCRTPRATRPTERERGFDHRLRRALSPFRFMWCAPDPTRFGGGRHSVARRVGLRRRNSRPRPRRRGYRAHSRSFLRVGAGHTECPADMSSVNCVNCFRGVVGGFVAGFQGVDGIGRPTGGGAVELIGGVDALTITRKAPRTASGSAGQAATSLARSASG